MCDFVFKKNLNASRPSEHPPVRGVVLCFLVAVVSICFLPTKYRRGVRYGVCSCFVSFLFFFRQLKPRDASLCACLPSFFYLIWLLPPSPSFFIFISLCGALVVLVLVFLSGLSCTAYMVTFLALRVFYVVVLCLFCFRLSFVSWFSLLNPFLATMSFAGYFHARFLLSNTLFPV